MKYYIVPKKYGAIIYFSSVIVLVLVTLFTSLNTAVMVINSSVEISKANEIPIYCVDSQANEVAITFNCAWGNSDIDEILQILDSYNAKSTFFVTGDFGERFPNEVIKIAQYGHEIASHSYMHPHVASISQQELIDDTLLSVEILQRLISDPITLYRAPYGEYNDNVVQTIQEQLGYTVIQWSLDSRDWQKPPLTEIANNILNQIEKGDIVLFHTDTQPTPQAVSIILEQLSDMDYRFITVSELLIEGEYYIDNNGKQNKIN